MKTQEVKLAVTAEERSLIVKIVARYADIRLSFGWCITRETRLSIEEDLAATHLNGCPLDLQRLFEADDFGLSHDIQGILACIDRSTGQLTRHFWPICARKEIQP